MVNRFEENMISDFEDYFNQQWCAAIFHDRFSKFFENVLDTIVKLESSVNQADKQNEIRKYLHKFLIENADLLPDYFTSEDQLDALDDN